MPVPPYTYFTFQHRTVAESPWLKPDAPCVPVKKEEQWRFSSWDHFGRFLNPLEYVQGGSVRFKYKQGCEEPWEVWSHTQSYGYWTLAAAKAALKRLRKADAAGEFDIKDGYSKKCQASRHQFRLVRVIHYPDVVEAMEL